MHDPATGGAAACDQTVSTTPQVISICARRRRPAPAYQPSLIGLSFRRIAKQTQVVQTEAGNGASQTVLFLLLARQENLRMLMCDRQKLQGCFPRVSGFGGGGTSVTRNAPFLPCSKAKASCNDCFKSRNTFTACFFLLACSKGVPLTAEQTFSQNLASPLWSGAKRLYWPGLFLHSEEPLREAAARKSLSLSSL